MIPLVNRKVLSYDVLEFNFGYAGLNIVPLERELLIRMHPQLLRDALRNWKEPGPSMADTPCLREVCRPL